MRLCLGHILILVVAFFAATSALATDGPKRVVSLNVCTDQLAMLLAKDGQLQSVSFLASDPQVSLLHEEAKAYRLNHGGAEEIFLMKPDLILAGSYTTRSTVQMLKRLGFRVEEFAPENSIEEVKATIRRMGTLLGQDVNAAAMLADIDQRLQHLQRPSLAPPKAVFYYANSYTSGAGTMISDMAAIAGLNNLGDQNGRFGTAYLSLEELVLSKPDLIVANGELSLSPALAQQNFQHPAYQELMRSVKTIHLDGRLASCGTPFTINAIEQLNAAALQISAAQTP